MFGPIMNDLRNKSEKQMAQSNQFTNVIEKGNTIVNIVKSALNPCQIIKNKEYENCE